MLFNSLHFFIFLPVVVALYYLLAPNFRWILLFVASCYFYMSLIPVYILILFLIILIDYTAALTIEQLHGRLRKFYLVVSILANIGVLAFFKYFNFLNENMSVAFGLFGQQYHMINLNIALPIGLSFHTFQSMSYTIEVYRGKQKAERHLGYFANYVLFFPQMVAGPIERYDRLGNQLKEIHVLNYENLSRGFRLVLFGLFIKMAVADNLAPLVNTIYDAPEKYNSTSILTGLFFFSYQIYADFYGYSLIAMGSASLMGIQLMDNFKTPYLAKNIHEFWQRWHISLSTWFRDYVYFSLGGNKVKFARWTFNILIVFAISGLWHGANWTFVIWGLLHGTLYLIERIVNKLFNLNPENQSPVLRVFRIIKTFSLVTFIWVFFRSENLEKAMQIFHSIYHNISLNDDFYVDPKIIALVLSFILSDFILFNSRIDLKLNKLSTPIRFAVYTVLLFCIMALSGVQSYPFIYFQF